MINKKVYQEILNEIVPFVPQDWTKLVIYLEYGENSYSFSFYYKDNEKYIKCYDIPNVLDEQLMVAFSKIDKIVSPERKNIKENLWTNMTIVINSDGKMKADFDYTDLSNGSYKYKKEWKEKYLV